MIELQTQLKQLTDRAELVDMLYRLGAALDEKRFDDLRTIYSERAVFEFADNPDVGDLDTAVESAKKMGKHFAHTHHVMTNQIIEIDGDRAAVRANLIATHVYRDDRPGEHYEAGIVYTFMAVRTAHGWRFSHVKLQRIWSNGRWDA